MITNIFKTWVKYSTGMAVIMLSLYGVGFVTYWAITFASTVDFGGPYVTLAVCTLIVSMIVGALMTYEEKVRNWHR